MSKGANDSSVDSDDQKPGQQKLRSISRKLRLVPAMTAAAAWIAVTLISNLLVILFIAASLRSMNGKSGISHSEVVSYFLTSGNAGTIALGLIAGAVVDLAIKSHDVGRLHTWLTLVAILGALSACIFFPEVVAGGAEEHLAQTVFAAMLIFSGVLGVAGAVLAARTRAR